MITMSITKLLQEHKVEFDIGTLKVGQDCIWVSIILFFNGHNAQIELLG